MSFDYFPPKDGRLLLYAEVPGVDIGKVIEYHRLRFRPLIQDKGVKQFYSPSGKSCFLFMESQWDSEIFAEKIAQIPVVSIHPSDSYNNVSEALDALVDHADMHNVECIIGRFYTNDPVTVPLLLKKGFSIAEIIVMMCLKIEKFKRQKKNRDIEISTAQKEEIPLIQDLIVGNYQNHFCRDSRFPVEKSQKMLREWMRNCFGGRADLFLVSRRNGRVIGFLAIRILREEAVIFGRPIGFVEMIVVQENYRGREIAYALFQEGVDWLADHCDMAILNVALTNVSAINFYAKVGFKILSSRYTFHGWVEDLQ